MTSGISSLGSREVEARPGRSSDHVPIQALAGQMCRCPCGCDLLWLPFRSIFTHMELALSNTFVSRALILFRTQPYLCVVR
jgi:hypothetical protein